MPGLLQTCVDRALKAVEDGDFHNGDPVVDCARQILKEDLFLGAEDVSFENERRCGNFVKAYMQDVEFPEYLEGGFGFSEPKGTPRPIFRSSPSRLSRSTSR